MSRKQNVIRLYSGFADGAIAVKSEIEISQTSGIPNFDIIGLCDSSIRESRGRIRAAINASGFVMPKGQITVNISPAYMHKSGSAFDLAIAIGLLIVSNQLSLPTGTDIYAEGELSLDGKVKSTPGSAIRFRLLNNTNNLRIVFPLTETDSARINSIEGYPVSTLKEAVETLSLPVFPSRKFILNNTENIFTPCEEDTDISILKGQEKTVRALLIAAAGWHNLLLVGSPGAGKTLAGRILHSLLPPLYPEEIEEVYSVRNMYSDSNLLLSSQRPYRYIHQLIAPNKLICNGLNMSPGELLLANRGILFADELCEFSGRIIDLLREPMEDNRINILKDGQTYTFNSNFIFIGATNPCKCGMYMEPSHKCSCTPGARHRYLSKLSGPFLDRIDLFSELHMIDEKALKNSVKNNSENKSPEYRKKVSEVWEICKERYKAYPDKNNGTVIEDNLTELFRVNSNALESAVKLSTINGYSARGINRLLRVSRTIADLNNDKDVENKHVMEAQLYKNRIFNQWSKNK
ncbi:MAG: ATP-binding protein [Clostridia bacterium]|nr:ATP-binding protein [Clostridia bacterium]